MWIASLSNGETVRESMTPKDEPTAWQRLLGFCKETGTEITGLQLIDDSLYLGTVSKKVCDGFFQAYEIHKRFRQVSGSPVPVGDRHYQGIGSVIDGKIYIQWLWLNPPDNSELHVLQDVRDLDENSVEHCFMFPENE